MRDAVSQDDALPGAACHPAAAAAAQVSLTGSPSLLLDVLEPELRRVMALFAADAAGVHLLDDPERPLLRLTAQQGLSAQEEQAAALAPLDGTFVGRCVTCPDARLRLEDNGHATASWERGHATFVVQPMRTEQGVIGTVWCLSRAHQLPEAAPQLLPLVAQQLSDLIVRSLLLQQVGHERQEYQLLADHLGEAIWTLELEPSLRTVLVSRTIESLTGYTPDDLLADPGLWFEMVYPDDRQQLLLEIERIRAGLADELHHRVRVIRQNGEIRWAHTRGSVSRDGATVRVYGLTGDVTDHVRLEERVRRADRLSAVGMLAGGIAHEYNNLHFAILGTLDLLLMREDLADSVRQHINRVREAAERASDITTKLVSFARGGTGGREELDVAELVDSALTLVQKEFSTRGIQVEIMQSPLPLRVQGNRGELGQALINLIINAQQAMQEGPTKRLTVATGLDDDRRVFISVADTGHGIAPEILPRLFDPFFTTKGAAGSWLEDRAASDAYLAGQGLGLSVVQTIIQEHGGHVEVESEVNCGTKFTIRLPAPDLADQVPTDDRPARPGTTGRILIADDEEAVRLVCTEMLRRLHYDVTEAAGGQEALRLLQSEMFDLILVDLQMPDMTGQELMRRINELPPDRRPAKLVITGNIDEVPPQTCAELGICGLLQKRGNLSELVSKVQIALASRQA